MKKYLEGQLWTDKPRNFFGLSISFTRYILTEDKLITRHGLLRIREDELYLYRVVDKKLDIPLGQKVFGLGTVHLITKDHDTPEKILSKIKDPRRILSLLDTLIYKARQKQKIYGQDIMLGGNNPSLFDADNDGIADILEQ